jgi:type IV secretory pathway protease TraF
LKLHLASNDGFGPRAKPLIVMTIGTAGLIVAVGGLVDARAPLALINTTRSEPIGLYWRRRPRLAVV